MPQASKHENPEQTTFLFARWQNTIYCNLTGLLVFLNSFLLQTKSQHPRLMQGRALRLVLKKVVSNTLPLL